MADDLSLGGVDLGTSAYELPSTTGTAQNDIASALGGAVTAAATNGLQAIAANYQKVFNPTTGSWQAVSGNTPTGGQPASSNVVSLSATMSTFSAWIKAHPIMAGILGIAGLAGLFYGAKAVFRK